MQKRNGGERSYNDFLDILLSENDPRTGEKFPTEDIGIDINDLLAAGHETTSNTITFVLYLLAKNPDVQERLRQESDSFSDSPSYEDAAKMLVANLVIKETLRMFPIVPEIMRRTTKDATIKFPNGKELHIPEADNIIFSMHSLGRDERNFSNPESFDINRWTNEDEDNLPSAWIPFGLGIRSCVGQRMAMMEAKIILSMIMQKYTIRLHPEQEEPLEIVTALTLRAPDLKLQFLSRHV